MIGRLLSRWVLIPAVAALAACGDSQEPSPMGRIAGGEPETGRALIRTYGCGTCHTIDGVRGARGKVGPRLTAYAQQHLLAGFLPNTPRNLIAWLMDPVALKSQTGMPSQGLTETEARHIAAYLYSLGPGGLQVHPEDPPLPLRGPGGPEAGIPGSTAIPSSDTEPRTRRIVPDPGAGRGSGG